MARLSEGAVRQLVLKYWNTADVVNTDDNKILSVIDVMVEIARLESGFETTAHNTTPPDNSYGLWQINMIGPLGVERKARFGLKAATDLFNPDTNARVAHEIWKDAGMSVRAWSTADEAKRNLVGQGKIVTDVVATAHESGLYPGQLAVEDAAGNAIGAVVAWAEGLAKLLRIILSADFWKRLGIGALGLLIVIGGVAFIAMKMESPATPIATQLLRKAK